MITSIEKPSVDFLTYHQNKRKYALLVNAGIIWHFEKEEKQRK